jgi:flagellar basal body-associated protein FliL
MYKIGKRKAVIITILLFVVTTFASAITAYFIARSQSNVHFVSQPREENESYGYLEINGNKYYQLYTTTQVDIGNGLHYHRIDLRSSDPQGK